MKPGPGLINKQHYKMKYYLLLAVAIIFFTDKPLPKDNTDCCKKIVGNSFYSKTAEKVFITNVSCGSNLSN
jgi:hypothetical protein